MDERYEQLLELLLKSEEPKVVALAEKLAERGQYQKAVEQGKRESLQDSIPQILEWRFNQSAADIVDQLRALPLEALEVALHRAVTIFSLADFRRYLQELK
jgi:hypothetical protein